MLTEHLQIKIFEKVTITGNFVYILAKIDFNLLLTEVMCVCST